MGIRKGIYDIRRAMPHEGEEIMAAVCQVEEFFDKLKSILGDFLIIVVKSTAATDPNNKITTV